MPKKTKLGKGRLDKYYNMAKQQGYRSRASFKLIQINKKYNILNKAKVVIDLCAAPGGWLQVCEKFCPYGSIKIGVDLDKIPPIPGCKTFQEDITTPQCYKILKNELSGQKADVVLNDGAPNVGQNWSKDAFTQIELTLSALKLAVNFLRKGGTFITKVFRSTDYNALVYVMKKFFKKVEANKPLASRFASAEIFVCCIDFIAPDFIDEKLFDSKYIFKDTEFEISLKNANVEINSVDKILEKRRKRQGYADDAKQNMSSKIPFDDFIHAENPYPIFVQYTEIGLPSEEMSTIVPPPKFYDEYLQDLQVLGRRELGTLIKWRGQIRQKLRSQKQQTKQLKEGEEEDQEEGEEIEEVEEGEEFEGEDEGELSENENIQELNEEDADKFESGDEFEDEQGPEQEDEIDDEQLEKIEEEEDEFIKKQKKKELKELKKKKEKQEKQITNQGVSVEFQGNFDDQELFTISHKKALKKAGYIEVDDEVQEIKINKIRMTQSDIEDNLERIYEAQKNKKGKKEKLLKPGKNDLENSLDDNKLKCDQLQDKIENMKNKKSIKSQNLDDKEQEELIKSKIFQSNWFDRDIFKGVGGIQSIESEVQKQKQGNVDLFINPVTGQRSYINKDDYDNLEDDNEEEENDEEYSKDDILEQKKSKLSSDLIEEEQKNGEQEIQEEDEDEEFEDEEEEYEEGEEDSEELDGYSDVSGENDDDEMYIDETLLKKRNFKDYQENLNIDPNEKVKGEKDDDEAYKLSVPQSDMEIRRNKMKKLQKRLEKKSEKNKKEVNELNIPIEYVPETKIEDFDLETLAETRVLARKMLRKGQREALIDSSYSRYANDDEEIELPAWFLEDEQKYNYKHMPVTRDEIKNELEYIKSINNRAPKKVLEAKIRKQKRLEKKMKRTNEKVSEIFEQDGISEGMKIQQAKKLYAKSIQQVKNPKKKQTIVAKKFKSGKVNQGSKSTSYVDSRLRKDLNAQKRAGTDKRGNGGRQKSKNRQISRRKKKAHKY